MCFRLEQYTFAIRIWWARRKFQKKKMRLKHPNFSRLLNPRSSVRPSDRINDRSPSRWTSSRHHWTRSVSLLFVRHTTRRSEESDRISAFARWCPDSGNCDVGVVKKRSRSLRVARPSAYHPVAARRNGSHTLDTWAICNNNIGSEWKLTKSK